jgi:rhodanese-related sulfurtransferase
MPLSDDLIVYPNHGAGSACGKKMSKETTDTLGNQKRTNYALRADMTREEFIDELLTGLTNPPGYFPKNVLMNIQGYESLDTVMERGNQALTPSQFERIANETNALILDTRAPEVFAKGFIPNAINIGLDGSFAMWVGEMIPDIQQEILLVTDEGKEEETITRLSRVGYDHAIGYLSGGFAAWKNEQRDYDEVHRLSAEKFAQEYVSNPIIIDVRKKSEYASEHVINAKNIPLNELNDRFFELPKDQPFIIHCAGGYRSMIAASILKSRGYHDFVDVEGGMTAILNTPVPKTAYVCPTTLL